MHLSTNFSFNPEFSLYQNEDREKIEHLESPPIPSSLSNMNGSICQEIKFPFPHQNAIYPIFGNRIGAPENIQQETFVPQNLIALPSYENKNTLISDPHQRMKRDPHNEDLPEKILNEKNKIAIPKKSWNGPLSQKSVKACFEELEKNGGTQNLTIRELVSEISKIGFTIHDDKMYLTYKKDPNEAFLQRFGFIPINHKHSFNQFLYLSHTSFLADTILNLYNTFLNMPLKDQNYLKYPLELATELSRKGWGANPFLEKSIQAIFVQFKKEVESGIADEYCHTAQNYRERLNRELKQLPPIDFTNEKAGLSLIANPIWKTVQFCPHKPTNQYPIQAPDMLPCLKLFWGLSKYPCWIESVFKKHILLDYHMSKYFSDLGKIINKYVLSLALSRPIAEVICDLESYPLKKKVQTTNIKEKVVVEPNSGKQRKRTLKASSNELPPKKRKS